MDKFSIFITICFVVLPIENFYFRSRNKSVWNRVKSSIFGQLLLCVATVNMFLRSQDRIEKVDHIMLSLAISFIILLFLVLFESQRLRISQRKKEVN